MLLHVASHGQGARASHALDAIKDHGDTYYSPPFGNRLSE